MSKSVERVEAAAAAAGLDISVMRMPSSTRTAEEAALACGCDVAQIVKSMVFQCVVTARLKLILVSGAHDLKLERAPAMFGEALARADVDRVRAETGFAIGGVAPIGHLRPIETWMDAALLEHQLVWAAAGAPDAVFSCAPTELLRATGAELFSNG